MAPMTSSSSKPVESNVPIEEIVFSCSICQATVSEVYATTESNQGFHSGSGDEDGIITKFWITECSHTTCATHLENGAAPFHPKGLPPKAPCPKCLRDKGDDAPRNLYGVRGLGEGEYDPMIPGDWLRCPAIKLDSSTPEISAVRFQYMALVNYSLEVRKRWMTAQNRQSAMESACSKERKYRRQLQSELQPLQQRIESLEEREAEWKKWEERRPMINHYLGAFARMSSEMESMRSRLLDFGVVVPQTKYMIEPPQTSVQNYLSPGKTAHAPAQHQRNHERAAATLPSEPESSSSTRKRKREDGETDRFRYDDARARRPSGASRNLMPPPLPRPRQQQRVVDDLTGTMVSSAMLRPLPSQQPVQIHGDGDWTSAQPDLHQNQSSIIGGRCQTERNSAAHRALPYRSGVIEGGKSRNSTQPNLTFYDNSGDVQARFRGLEGDRFHAAHQSSQYHTQSQQEQSNRYSDAEVSRRFPTIDEQPIEQHFFDSQAVLNGAHKSRSLQQTCEMRRAPPQTLSDFDTNRLRTITPRTHPSDVATPVRRDSSLPRPLESSPFFRRDDQVARPHRSQRPPIRGSFVRKQYDAPFQNGTASVSYDSQGMYHTPRTSNHPTQKASHLPFHNPPFRHPDIGAQYRYKTPVPQTPRNFQGLLHRPDRPMPSMEQPAFKPQANTMRSRVSLPVGYGPQLPAASNPDQALLHVPGVRGLSSQRGPPSYQRMSSAYGAPRTLLSSAGGRRSVLR